MFKTKRAQWIITVATTLLVVGGVVWFVVSRAGEKSGFETDKMGEVTPPFESHDPAVALLALDRDSNKVEVFRRAFWRNPVAEDTIHFAERREWSDATGVQQWDWFIAVTASESLTSYLLKQNAFQLNVVSGVQTFGEVPAWFPRTSEDFEIYQSEDGAMTVLYDADSQQLYAKSEGYGFKAGAPEPRKPPTQVIETGYGRLPDAPPPDPGSP